MVKKLLIAAITLCIIFWIGACLMIPNPLQVSSVKYIRAPLKTINELATMPANWKRWWPGGNTDTVYKYQSYQYTATLQEPYSLQIAIGKESETFTSHLLVLPLAQDSVVLQWKTELSSGINPFTRIKKYNQALLLKKDLQILLDSLSAFATNKQKIYGLPIEITRFTNPYMISTQATFAGYPSVDNIYETINTLRTFAKEQQAQPVDSPMINIEPVDEKIYLLRAALPVNKKLPVTKGIEFKQMVLGNTLRGTITGGQHTVEQALVQMRNYIDDNRLSSPAIPFQLLITNRQQQPDSNKWITKLYYPIF